MLGPEGAVRPVALSERPRVCGVVADRLGPRGGHRVAGDRRGPGRRVVEDRVPGQPVRGERRRGVVGRAPVVVMAVGVRGLGLGRRPTTRRAARPATPAAAIWSRSRASCSGERAQE